MLSEVAIGVEKMVKNRPEWLKIRVPSGENYQAVRRVLKREGLHTVCEHARCPNLGECWSERTATFMILGHTCTRGCRFCAVDAGQEPPRMDETEPCKVARAAQAMAVRHAVITSVTRDDLSDKGAAVFSATVRALRRITPPPSVELLIPDLPREYLQIVIQAKPAVLAHNI